MVVKNYTKTQPCNNCPYRKDAPVQYWSVKEFQDLIINESSQFGVVYGCHKKNGHVCVGWLINQDKNNFPSIMLRLSLSKNNVTRKYLDRLTCKSEMFDTIEEMVTANYKELNNESEKS